MKEIVDNEILRQLNLIEKGKIISSEVRNALPNGETEFLRPMPGAARMYPETDLPLLKISREMINEIKKDLPKLRTDIKEELKKEGLTDELVKLILEDYLDNFKSLLKIYPEDPQLIAKMLTLWRNELATKLKKDISQINEVISFDALEILLEEIKKGNINKNQIKPIFSELMEGVLLKDIIVRKIVPVQNIEEEIMKIIKEKPGLNANAYMGLVMGNQNLRGKISGAEAMEIIKKYVK